MPFPLPLSSLPPLLPLTLVYLPIRTFSLVSPLTVPNFSFHHTHSENDTGRTLRKQSQLPTAPRDRGAQGDFFPFKLFPIYFQVSAGTFSALPGASPGWVIPCISQDVTGSAAVTCASPNLRGSRQQSVSSQVKPNVG